MEGVDDQPCEYELQRERRIARNQEVMREMGLLDIAAPVDGIRSSSETQVCQWLSKTQDSQRARPLEAIFEATAHQPTDS